MGLSFVFLHGYKCRSDLQGGDQRRTGNAVTGVVIMLLLTEGEHTYCDEVEECLHLSKHDAVPLKLIQHCVLTQLPEKACVWGMPGSQGGRVTTAS